MVLTRMITAGLAVVASLLLLAAPIAKAQPAGKVWRIGYLTPSDIPRETLIAALRELGYVEGRTAKFEIRSAQNDFDRLPQQAADLVRTPVDIIVAVSPPAIVAAKRATATIPIVMAFWGGEGLIESGVVASFSRPGGNVTGVYMLADELDAGRCAGQPGDEQLQLGVGDAAVVGRVDRGHDGGVEHVDVDVQPVPDAVGQVLARPLGGAAGAVDA